MRNARRIAAVAFALAAGFVAAKDRPALGETVLQVPVVSGAGTQPRTDLIEVTLFKPAGAGPHPVVVLSHGSPRSVQERRQGGRFRFEAASRALAAMGFAVAVPTRRGYGDSQGEWSEGYGRCDRPDYHLAGLETARDILSTVETLRKDPSLDTKRVVLAGQSAGGWGSVAAATSRVDGLVGIINFAGGRGSFATHQVCGGEQALVEAMRLYGAQARVPQLWIYAANDQFFRPELSRRLHEAFVAAGGQAEFVAVPAFGQDGHGYFARAVGDWAARVQPFLARAASGAGLARATSGDAR